MVDKTELAKDFTKLFMRYQHRLDNPMPAPVETEQALIDKYLRDPMFHAKVDALTYGVMNVVDRHI